MRREYSLFVLASQVRLINITCRCRNFLDSFTCQIFHPINRLLSKNPMCISDSIIFSHSLLVSLSSFYRIMSTKSSVPSTCPCPPNVLFFQRITSALFYALCSGLITVVNKIVLTSYGYVLEMNTTLRGTYFVFRFPSFQLLAIGQVNSMIRGILLIR